jgi:hypothetical protein
MDRVAAPMRRSHPETAFASIAAMGIDREFSYALAVPQVLIECL